MRMPVRVSVCVCVRMRGRVVWKRADVKGAHEGHEFSRSARPWLSSAQHAHYMYTSTATPTNTSTLG